MSYKNTALVRELGSKWRSFFLFLRQFLGLYLGAYFCVGLGLLSTFPLFLAAFVAAAAAVTLFATFFASRPDLLPPFASGPKVGSFCACTPEGLPL